MPPVTRPMLFATPVSYSLVAVLLTVSFAETDLSAQSGSVTFTQDIAPIISTHCANCHRPGGGAPFSLTTFEDVRPRAMQIARVAKTRYMPPWKPEPGHGEFVGARRLSEEQLTLIQQWTAAGAIRGDPRDSPVVARSPGEWQLGKPDLVVTMPEPYFLSPDGPDVLRTFVIPIPASERRHVKALEFSPGSYHAVHHANIKIDQTRGSRRLDAAEFGPGYDGGGGRDAKFPDGYFLGWTPGQLPRVSPEGMAWQVEPGSDLVVELHMMPNGTEQRVQFSVGFTFTDQPPTRLPYMLRLGRQDIDIPAGAKGHAVVDTFVLPVDIEALAVQPHAHTLATEVRGLARLPDGTTKPLIYIRAWDFNWQDVYRYLEPLQLPRGTMLEMRYTYDNSTGNARNSTRPPTRVTFGQTTSSEMGDLWLQVVPRNSADRALLHKEFAPKMLAEDIAGYNKVLEVNPEDARAHYDLASAYLALGRVADAVIQLGEVLRLDPTSPWADYDLGIVRLQQKRFDEAEHHFRRAVTLKPDFSEAYNNLGVVHHVRRKVGEALGWYQEALRVNPENADAHYNVGRVRAAQGEVDEALAAFRQALRIKPYDAEVHSRVGGLLASRSHVKESIAHYRRALELRPDLPEALKALALAHAEMGEFDQALDAAEVALALASTDGDQQLATQIRMHLAAWQSHR